MGRRRKPPAFFKKKMALRYNLPFFSLDEIEWEIKVFDEDFGDDPEEFNGSFQGFNLTYEGDSSDPFTPVVPSSVTFDFLIEDSEHETFLSNLTGAREGRFKVAIYREGNLDWLGYLVADQTAKSDEYYPYHTQLFAVDGIARMKDVDYLQANGQPYVGSQTFLQHLYNCIAHVGLMDLVTMPATRFRSNCNWYSEDMVTTTDPLTQASFHNDRTISKDNEGNPSYWSVLQMLEAICMQFGARFFFSDGAYYFLQVGEMENATQKIRNFNAAGSLISTQNAVDFDLDIDYSTEAGAKKRRGGIYTYLQAAKRVNVDYHHFTSKNRLTGVGFNQSVTAYQTLPGEVLVDADNTTSLKTVLNFKVKSNVTITGGGAYPAHKYVFRVYIRINGYYLKRNVTGSFYDIIPDEASWVATENYIETHSPILTSFDNLNDVLFQLKINSPYLLTGFANGEPIEVKVLLHEVQYPGNNTLDYNSFLQVTESGYSGTLFWNAEKNLLEVINEGLGINPDNETIRYGVYDSSDGNTAVLQYDTYFGDGPAPFSVSRITDSVLGTELWKVGGTGTGYPINERLAREIISIRQTPLPVFQVSVLSGNYRPYLRVVDGSDAYFPLRLNFNAFSDEWSGEFVKIGRVFTLPEVEDPHTPPSSPTDPNVIKDPFTPTVPHIPYNEGHVGLTPYAIGEALAGAVLDGDAVTGTVNGFNPNQLTISPVAFAFAKAGDKFKIVDPASGKSQLLTIAADYVPGATTLKITEDLASDYPDGSLLVAAPRHAPPAAPRSAHQHNTPMLRSGLLALRSNSTTSPPFLSPLRRARCPTRRSCPLPKSCGE